MTVQELLLFFENYYAEKYSPIVRNVMLNFLNGHSAAFYDAVGMVIVRRFSRTFKMSPGPTEIEKYMDEILASMPKPELLPEPRHEITAEERVNAMKILDEIKQILLLKRKHREAMNVGRRRN